MLGAFLLTDTPPPAPSSPQASNWPHGPTGDTGDTGAKQSRIKWTNVQNTMDNFSEENVSFACLYACRSIILDIYTYKYIDLTRDYISLPKQPDLMLALSIMTEGGM